jgi:ADP-heptose:LPS heptosyltransferase/Flp pilus assembly protein TadD
MPGSPDVEDSVQRARALTREANALREQGRWQEALPLLFEAARIDRENAAPAHNLGVLLAKIGRLAEGEAMTRHALSVAPQTPMIIHALAHNLLAQGRFKEGFPLYRIRALMPELNSGFPHDFPFPRWHNEPLAGKRLVIFPEQGLGDQIQLARFLPSAIGQAGAVTLLTVLPLERLFRHNFPNVEIVPAVGTAEFPDPDYWATMYDLAGAFVTGSDTIPGTPYLRVPGTWPSLGDGFKTGLKTRGNPKHLNDKARSLPEQCAARLRAGLPGNVISLEPDDSGARDMADTAAIIAQLDLVVSVDTSVAHLAGALGKPCLLLIPGYGADWRWMTQRDDSPWYPDHRLFRGTVDGDWTDAVDRLLAEARRRAAPAATTAPRLTPTSSPPKGSLQEMLSRGDRLRAAGRYSEALDLIRRALRTAPDNPAGLELLGAALFDVGRLKEAEQYQRRALAKVPDHPIFQNMLALNLLAQGRYREAWPLHEGRSEKSAADIGFPTGVPCARWRGEPLAGKHIVILPEQGFGDAIQFARFLPRLRATGARITLFAPPALVDLFATSFPEVQVQAAAGDVRLGDPDYWTTLVDMMAPLDVTLEDVPCAPYLVTERAWPAFPGGFTIGLVTSGNPHHVNDSRRSLDADMVQRLRKGLPGTVVSLDPRESGARDFADTAALIARLDLVVAVDTSVAHLAGALGKPCLLLVPSLATDWRWMRDRDDSPWYAGHRLFRSAMDGNWSDAIDRLCAHAVALSQAKAGGTPAMPKRALGRWGGALKLARSAAAAQPKAAAPVRQLGGLLTQIGDLEEGEAILRRAIALGGDQTDRARYQLGLNLLAQGRYQEAWPLYQSRRAIADLGIGYPRGIDGPRWEGQSLAGKRLLVLAEQGMGDTLQLARFLPELVERGAHVTLFERAPLIAFLQAALPSAKIRDVAEIASAGPQDIWTTTFDMLEPLGVTLRDLPPAAYAATRFARTAGSDFSIGISTAGNRRHRNDGQRSLTADMARQLIARLPGRIVDLDPAKTGARNFAETAALMAELDLIVSVDTAVAHLAGAMDKDCLLLLPGFDTDWRWLRGRDDSPWYPRHRLYRGGIDGNWSEAIDPVVRDARVAAQREMPA